MLAIDVQIDEQFEGQADPALIEAAVAAVLAVERHRRADRVERARDQRRRIASAQS